MTINQSVFLDAFSSLLSHTRLVPLKMVLIPLKKPLTPPQKNRGKHESSAYPGLIRIFFVAQVSVCDPVPRDVFSFFQKVRLISVLLWTEQNLYMLSFCASQGQISDFSSCQLCSRKGQWPRGFRICFVFAFVCIQKSQVCVVFTIAHAHCAFSLFVKFQKNLLRAFYTHSILWCNCKIAAYKELCH